MTVCEAGWSEDIDIIVIVTRAPGQHTHSNTVTAILHWTACGCFHTRMTEQSTTSYIVTHWCDTERKATLEVLLE